MKPYGFIKVVIVCTLLCSITPLYAVTPWLHVDGNDIKDPAGNVVVLRGLDTIDIGSVELGRGGVINLIDRVTNKNNTEGNSPGWYPRVIRLAVYPKDETATSGPWYFEADHDHYYNDLLRPIVDHCKEKDLYAIIDWHYVGRNTYDVNSQTKTFWEYIAPRFANDSHVIFELLNEPNNTSGGSETANWLTLMPYMQTWINLVRTYAPDNLILVGGPSWSQQIGPAADYPLDGNNIVMVAHIYPGHWLLWGQEYFKNQVLQALTVYPVFATEWGFWGTSEDLLNGTITNYGQPLMDFYEGLKISHSAWVTDYVWSPPMFTSSWALRVGEAEMGGFTKDMLYEKRNDDQPSEGDNIPPTVSITSPLNGDIFYPGDDIVIEANASDSDGNVTKVEFYKDFIKSGEDTSAPYSYTWSDVPAGQYSLTAKATDNNNETRVSSAVSIGVYIGEATGTILREWWTGILGSAVSVLTSDVNYPTNPNGRGLITRLQGPINWADQYGARIRGYLYPPVDGSYTFWISSAAKSELRLSTDADPCHSVLIASESTAPYPAQHEWEKYPAQRSSPIWLTAGGKYYIEVLHKESISLDHVAVAWEGPGISQQVINGAFLSPWLFNFKEFSGFAAQWQRTDCAKSNAWCSGADRDRDGNVQIDDLVAFADWWLLE